MGNECVAKRAISRSSGGDVRLYREFLHLAVARPGGQVCVHLKQPGALLVQVRDDRCRELGGIGRVNFRIPFAGSAIRFLISEGKRRSA